MAARARKTGRIELRADRVSEKRIRIAASIAKQTVSTFMLEAATRRADEVIAQAHEVVLPAKYFDAVWAALSRPPRANRRLAAVAKQPAPYVQR